MKTRHNRTVPIANQISRVAPPTAMGIQTFQLIKPRLAVCLLALCAFATTTVFGQVTQIWNGAADGTNIDVAGNFVSGVLPVARNGDTLEFNGVEPGNLSLVYDIGNTAYQSGYLGNGMIIYLTSSQTGSVNIGTTVSGTSAPLAIDNITIDSGAGAFTLGGPNSGSKINFIGRPASAIHALVNNSANTATLTPWILFTAGSGATYTLDFSGTGNWQCNSYLNNNNGAGMIIQVDGPGTMTWNPTGFLAANGINTPIVINGGTLVLTGPHPKFSANEALSLGGAFEFNAPAQSQTLAGASTGTGILQVNAGTLTLSGASTYGGTNLLTGGELIANGAENPGVSGPLGSGALITFAGGTLGYSVNNVFDYSSRFDPAPGQAYSIDTGGQNVTFTNGDGLASSGGTLAKLGAGTLTLAGTNSYSGSTTVAAGELVFQGPMTGTGNVTVDDGAALGITANGTQVTPGTLTVGTNTGATLEFFNVNSTTTAPLAPAAIASSGPATINVISGTFTVGQSYPLLAWTSGTAPAVNLGILAGYIGTLSTNGNTIQVNIQATAYKWSGNNNGSWDLATANNWIQNGGPVVFANGGPVLFDDSATTTNVNIGALVQPTSVTFNNNNLLYTIASSSGNDLGGSASVTKLGSGTVALSGGANTYAGATTISGGTLSVGTLANGGSPSDIGQSANNAANLVLNGGTLQYTGGGAGIDRLLTVGLAGGTIDASGSGALALTNTGSFAYSGNGPRTLTLTGTNAGTLAIALGNNGGATSLTKDNTGTWNLTGNNTYSGVTTVNNGELIVGTGGGTGSLGSGNVVDSGSLDFNRTNTLTVSGAISGAGSVTNDGTGTVILAGNNTYSGGTTINAGTLQIGNGGATGGLADGSPVIDNGLLRFNSTGSVIIKSYGGVISGTGNVLVHSGFVEAAGASAALGDSYTGWTEVDSGATFQFIDGNTGASASSVITNNGTLLFAEQNADPAVRGFSNNIVGSGKVIKDNNNQNAGWIVLGGTNNTYTGGTWILGGGIQLGDGITPGSGTIVGPVYFTNTTSSFKNTRYLIFAFADASVVWTNKITSVATDGAGGAVDNGEVRQYGSGVLTLTANNSWPGNTVISNGVLQVGANGTTGSIGTGSILDSASLVFDRSDNVTIANSFGQGSGALVQYGSGMLTLSTALNGTNSYIGATVVSNGTLVVSGTAGGDVDVSGGTLIAGPVASVSTFNLLGNMNINAGTVVAYLNKSLAASNTLYAVAVTNPITGLSNGIIAFSGTLKLYNYGPALAPGDKFTLFNQPVTNGAAMTIVPPPGVTAIINNLAVDGSVSITTVAPPPSLTASVSGRNLNLSWPSVWTGMHVQVQTNTLARGLSTNWFTIPGTDAGNSYSAAITSTNGAVFYRLAP